MPVSTYTTAPAEAPALHRALFDRAFLLIGLCAAWCGTCTDFRGAFDELAASRPDATCVWLDIEDDADLAGDIDVDNFPTIAVFHHGRLLHFGVSLPQAPIVARLLAALTVESPTVDAGTAVDTLPERLRHACEQQLQRMATDSSDSPSNAATN